jgi:hypothetical protein
MSKASRASKAQYRRYEARCTTARRSPLPPTYDTVASFLVDYTTRNTARTLGQVLTQLRKEVAARNAPWLSAYESRRLTTLVALLLYNDTSQCRRVAAFRLSYLADILDSWDLTSLAGLSDATTLTMGRDALLRGGELTSGIRARHIVFWPRDEGYTLWLRRTKTHRKGGGISIQVPDYECPISSCKLLRRLFTLRALSPSDFLFPMRRRGRILADRAASIAQLRRLVKTSVASIGLDASQFSAHSLRAGGATDLFAAGVPFAAIQKMGRWVSAAAVLYYRSVEDVWTTVGAAFSVMALRHSAAPAKGPILL